MFTSLSLMMMIKWWLADYSAPCFCSHWLTALVFMLAEISNAASWVGGAAIVSSKEWVCVWSASTHSRPVHQHAGDTRWAQERQSQHQEWLLILQTVRTKLTSLHSLNDNYILLVSGCSFIEIKWDEVIYYSLLLCILSSVLHTFRVTAGKLHFTLQRCGWS